VRKGGGKEKGDVVRHLLGGGKSKETFQMTKPLWNAERGKKRGEKKAKEGPGRGKFKTTTMTGTAGSSDLPPQLKKKKRKKGEGCQRNERKSCLFREGGEKGVRLSLSVEGKK